MNLIHSDWIPIWNFRQSNSTKSEDSIRTNPNQVLNPTSENHISNPNHSDLGFYRNDLDWHLIYINTNLDLFGLISMENLVRIHCIERYLKRFWTGSEKDFGMARNRSDSFALNSNLKHSLGQSISIWGLHPNESGTSFQCDFWTIWTEF